MASITAEELTTLQTEFMRLDTDGNGVVSIEELRTLLRSMRIKLKLSESQIKRCLKQIDINEDGIVDKGEMLEILEKFDTEGIVYKALNERANIRQHFLRYDKDGRGCKLWKTFFSSCWFYQTASSFCCT